MRMRVKAAAIGAHVHFQPVITPAEYARAEVNRDGKEAVGDRHAVGEDAAINIVVGEGVEGEPKTKVVEAAGRNTAVVEAALVGEGGVLGARLRTKPKQG